MSRHVMSRHVTSCRMMYLMSRHGTSCHVMSYHVMSRHVTSCHVMSHLAPSCHVMSYHVTSYHVESRRTVTRPTLHCQLTSSTRNQFKLSMTVFVGCPEGCRYHTASAVYDLVLFYGLIHKPGFPVFRCIIIIIFYFKNVAFFHAKLESDVCPRVDDQTSGDTLQDSTQTLSGKIAISQ